MRLTISMKQSGHRPKVLVTKISEPVTLETMRKLWEAEQALNSIPADLRVHISVEEDVS